MTERRSMEYLADDNTDALNQWNLGIINSGVYRGWNLDKTGGALVAKFIHTTGIVEIDKDENALTAAGCIVTKQGVRIKEDGAKTIGLTANATANYRIDTVYCQHEYIQTAGGAASTLGIIVGTAGATPSPAALSVPNKQMVIGYLVIPPNFADIAVDPIEWIQNPSPLHEDVSYSNWASLTYTALSKTIEFGDVLGNCFFASLTSTKEIQFITKPKRYGKLLKLWLKTDGLFVSGGNIDLDYGSIIFPANTYVEMIPRQLASGQVKWSIVTIHKGPGAYLNEINHHTKTSEFGYATLDGTIDYDGTTKNIITHGNGNTFLFTIVSSSEYKGIVVENTGPIDHQNGTVLFFKIAVTTPGDTATLQFASSNFNQPGGFGTSYLLSEGDEVIFTKRAGKWDVQLPTNVARRLLTLEGAAAPKINGSAGISSWPFMALSAGLVCEPAMTPVGQLIFKDPFGWVNFVGRKIKCTSAKAAGDTLFTMTSGNRPPNGIYQREAIYHAVPILNTGLIYSPIKMVTIRIDISGVATLYDDGLDVDDVIDLRDWRFLT